MSRQNIKLPFGDYSYESKIVYNAVQTESPTLLEYQEGKDYELILHNLFQFTDVSFQFYPTSLTRVFIFSHIKEDSFLVKPQSYNYTYSHRHTEYRQGIPPK